MSSLHTRTAHGPISSAIIRGRSRRIERSLCLLLPLHNADATLAGDAIELLETLPDIAARFEVVLIDDGSTDATPEIAEELARQYPQIRILRHAQRRGIEAAWAVGLARTDSAVVLGHDGRSPLDPSDIARLLRREFDSTATIRAGATAGLSSSVGASVATGSTAGQASSGTQRTESDVRPSSQFHRWLAERPQAVEPSAFGSSAFEPPVSAGGFRVLRDEEEIASERAIGAIPPPHSIGPSTIDAARGGGSVSATAPRRPRFLDRLKDFAFGQ